MESEHSTHDVQSLPAKVLTVAGSAERELALFSDTLSHRLWGSVEFCEIVRTLVIRHERNRVRVLVRQPEQVLADGAHRLIELARQIPSRIQMRGAVAPADVIREEWLIADRRGVVQRHDTAGDQAVARPDDPGRASALLARFNTYWEHGSRSREFDELRL